MSRRFAGGRLPTGGTALSTVLADRCPLTACLTDTGKDSLLCPRTTPLATFLFSGDFYTALRNGKKVRFTTFLLQAMRTFNIEKREDCRYYSLSLASYADFQHRETRRIQVSQPFSCKLCGLSTSRNDKNAGITTFLLQAKRTFNIEKSE